DILFIFYFFFFSSRRRHTRSDRDWSSDVCSSDLLGTPEQIDLTDRIFVFEDIHESPARIERYLAQLDRAGLLERAAGFLVGPLRSEERRVGKECRVGGGEGE